MRRGLCHRPETVHASSFADCPPSRGGGVCGHHYATRHYAHSARRGEKPGGSPDRQGFPASGGHHYSAVPVCDCVEPHRQVPYLEWPHTRQPKFPSGLIKYPSIYLSIPSGSVMAADAIIPNRRWQHSDETDTPFTRWEN